MKRTRVIIWNGDFQVNKRTFAAQVTDAAQTKLCNLYARKANKIARQKYL